MLKLVIFVLVAHLALSSAAITQSCLDAICKQESRCNLNIGCVMDVGSLSCGPYQIKEMYWKDCNAGTSWQSCASSKSCSEQCIKNYMTRYVDNRSPSVTGCKSPPTCYDYARVHNGGPSGCTKTDTIAYANSVLNYSG